MSDELQKTALARAVDLCAAARLFSLPQLARHPDFSWRGSPTKRAWEALVPYRDKFDVTVRAPGKPALWRLTNTAKKGFGLMYKNANPLSQKADHWLAIGDLWIAMTEAGGRPEVWNSQSDSIGYFDVYTKWQGAEFYIEVQLSRLSSHKWVRDKWEKRFAWLKETKRTGYVVCIDYTGSGKPYKGVRYFADEHLFASAVNRAVLKRG